MKFLKWMGSLFKTEPYAYKGSSTEIYDLYLSTKEILSNNTSLKTRSVAMMNLNRMATIMKTQGDGDLIRELHHKMKIIVEGL